MTTNSCTCACCAPADVEEATRSRAGVDPETVKVLRVEDRLAELEERLAQLEQRAS